MWEGTTSRVMVTDRPYSEFYDFYSVSPEYLGYNHINPLPSLTLQSAQDLNIPWQPKRSKVLLLCYTFKCPLKKTQSFCPCSTALNRSGKGLTSSMNMTNTTTTIIIIQTASPSHSLSPYNTHSLL
jgi:hypothetical protein